MRFGFLLIAFLIGFNVFGQYSFTGHKHSTHEQFLNSTTIVPLTGDKEFDEILQTTLNERWKFTPLKFLTKEELKDFNFTEEHSILSFLPLSYGYYLHSSNFALYLAVPPKYKSNASYIALVPLSCGSYDEHGFSDAREFTSECSIEDFKYKLEVILNQIIDVEQFVQDHKYTPIASQFTGIGTFENQFNKFYTRQRMKAAATKPLLVSKAFFNEDFKAEDFEKIYKKNYKLVEDAEYRSIIQSGNKEYIYLMMAQIPRVVLSVYDPETKMTVYVDTNMPGQFEVHVRKSCLLDAKQVKKLYKRMD